MMPADDDLFTKILSLPESARDDFLKFFGVAEVSQAEVEDLQDAIATSIAIKTKRRLVTTH